MITIPLNFTYISTLKMAGLNEQQALIYEYLLKNGPTPARVLVKTFSIERTLIYKILEKLIEMQVVKKKDEPKKVSVFEAAHPAKLEEYLGVKEQQIETAKKALASIVPQLTSDFNLVSSKPVVQFFEGVDGIERVTRDSLKAIEEIYTYLDYDAVDKHLPKLNEEYVNKREGLKIRKKIIAVDTPHARDHVAKTKRQFREVRFITSPYPFATAMQIYNDTVSYITLDYKKQISVLIRDEHIVLMHKALFLALWEQAKPAQGDTTAQPAHFNNA